MLVITAHGQGLYRDGSQFRMQPTVKCRRFAYAKFVERWAIATQCSLIRDRRFILHPILMGIRAN